MNLRKKKKYKSIIFYLLFGVCVFNCLIKHLPYLKAPKFKNDLSLNVDNNLG